MKTLKELRREVGKTSQQVRVYQPSLDRQAKEQLVRQYIDAQVAYKEALSMRKG